jgi:SseB protein C-terminal domain
MSGISFVSKGLRFLGEQDGIPERDLKEALKPLLLGDRKVERAYLARVQLAEADVPSVVMALVRQGGESEKLKGDIAAVFWVLFSSKNFLDVVFVSAFQDEELAACCRPFYERGPAPKGWLKRFLS